MWKETKAAHGAGLLESLKNSLNCRLTLFVLCSVLSRLLAVGADEAFAKCMELFA